MYIYTTTKYGRANMSPTTKSNFKLSNKERIKIVNQMKRDTITIGIMVIIPVFLATANPGLLKFITTANMIAWTLFVGGIVIGVSGKSYGVRLPWHFFAIPSKTRGIGSLMLPHQRYNLYLGRWVRAVGIVLAMIGFGIIMVNCWGISKSSYKIYLNKHGDPDYKFSYPQKYKIKEDFDEEEPGIYRNCIAVTSDKFFLGIAISGKHHPCYTTTVGAPDTVAEKKYVIQAKNSTFEVTETLGINNEIDQYGDGEYHKPDDRRWISVHGEGENGMYFNYASLENDFLANQDLIKQIISSIEWIQ